MSMELSCKTPDGVKQIAVRFNGGFDRGMGVQMCVKTVDLLDLLNYPAYIDGMMEPDMTVGDIIKWWLTDSFEEQSFNLDPKSFIRARAAIDLKGAFNNFMKVIGEHNYG